MRISTGVDIVEIERIRRNISNPAFLTRWFSPEEQQLFAQKGNPAATVAAHFAAKEAFSKALGTGIRGFALREVAVLRDDLGAPYFAFSGNALMIVAARKLCFSVSLSHSQSHAVAMVVAYQQ